MKLNSVLSPLSSLTYLPPLRRSSLSQPHLNLSLNRPSLSSSRLSRNVQSSSISAAVSSREEEAPSSAIHFAEIVEKDWSFLESEGANLDRIISAGEIGEDSRVLVSLGSEGFVDGVVKNCSSSQQVLLVVHNSLFVLAGIKEMYDSVKCWQGEIIDVPSKWETFDVVFLYFIPASPLKLDQILQSVSSRCSPGARIVISHPGGREALEEQRRKNPDVIVSELPDKGTVEKVGHSCSFEMSEFIDETGFYLAVLKFSSQGKGKGKGKGNE